MEKEKVRFYTAGGLRLPGRDHIAIAYGSGSGKVGSELSS